MGKRAREIWGRGGKRQRLACARALVGVGMAVEAEHISDVQGLLGDPEVACLLQLWALGLLPATTLQSIAKAAMEVAPRSQMEILRGIGTQGNAHRG